MQRLELAEHQQQYTGDLVMRLMGDVNMIRDLLFPSWLTLLSRGSVLIGGAIVFALVDIRLFLVRTSETFRNNARSAEKATLAAARHAARMARLTEILTGAGVALVLVLGAMRTRAGLLTPGELVLSISYTRMMYKPIRKIIRQGGKVAKATACALRVMALLDKPTEEPR